ncbi:hypothetical protein CGLO_09955 [Colletotrichum gloeosporioides Cg-14]|uniref:Uncharacterized protein n=1 Tax=Colletotrichum gloeosporioides (strain Cg-14) TaxID=1237896 RepID=T0KCC0_COLGC|nr:hypothetical protein CGLO_09955 [Colletotrichum gloeosporioides Cg-14]
MKLTYDEAKDYMLKGRL